MKQLRKDTLTARWMREPAKHEHGYGEETHDVVNDTWSRVCDECGHVDTYEKM
jgi:DNA-repair protein complementing XP-A cells